MSPCRAQPGLGGGGCQLFVDTSFLHLALNQGNIVMLDAVAKAGLCKRGTGIPVPALTHLESKPFFFVNFETGSHLAQAGSFWSLSETVLKAPAVPSQALGSQA